MRYLVWISFFAFITSVNAYEFQEEFSHGPGAIQSYHKPPDDTRIEWISHAESKDGFVRGTLTGKKSLEGLTLTASGLDGARLATVTASMRGKGEVWFCLCSRNGWLYAPQTVTLSSNQWQEISLSKVLIANDTTLGIDFLSKTPQPGAVFEVDWVRVKLADPSKTCDTAVAPWRFEAEGFVPSRQYIGVDATASAGHLAQDSSYLKIGAFPFPRTSKPVTIYARVRSAHATDKYQLITTQGGNAQQLTAVPATLINTWQWVKFSPVLTGEVGDNFDLVCFRNKNVPGKVAVDAVVLSTQPDMTDAQLSAAPELFGQRPLALVGRTAAPPVIDGLFVDQCWGSNAQVVCGGFVGIGHTAPAQAATRVKFCYDDVNLYAQFYCDEPILDPAQQRMHEFAAKITARDGDVYQDDCAILLLKPQGAQRLYDFAVNALGTIDDAVCRGPDWWNSRDMKWNSGARAAGKIENNYWTVELAIPWADLGGKPKLGDRWDICIGRLAKARKESTSWNLSRKGFHDPVQFGALVFEETAPGISLNPPPNLQAANQLVADVSLPAGKTNPVYSLVEVGLPTAIRHEYQFYAGGRSGVLTQKFDLPAEADIQIAYGLLDAATLRPLYLTPVLKRGLKSATANLTLTSDGAYELLLNEELVSRNNAAAGLKIKIPLQKGLNVLALKLAQGTAALKLEAPGTSSTTGTETWKISAQSNVNAVSSASDDSAWPQATQVTVSPQGEKLFGVPREPMVMRRTLLFEQTRVWPTPDPAFYLARGAAQHFNLVLPSFKSPHLCGWTTYVAVPPEFEVVGGTGFYGTSSPKQPQFICTQLGEQQISGRRMRVAKFSADKSLQVNSHQIMSRLQVFVRYREEIGEPKKDETGFLFWSEANDGSVTESPQSFKVRLLPKLNGAQCQTLVWQLWGGWIGNMDDLNMREAVLRCSQLSGFNDMAGGDRWISDHAPDYGLKNTLNINFESYSLNLRPYLKEHPDARLVNCKGKSSDSLMCMTMLLGDGWQAAAEQLRDKMDKVRPHTVDYDYEAGPENGQHSCYCPRCLDAFKLYANLPADTKLDAATIRKEYWPQWVDFMALRVAQMFAKFKATVNGVEVKQAAPSIPQEHWPQWASHVVRSIKKFFAGKNESESRTAVPRTLFSAYSGYQTPDNPERYGVNWQYVGKLQAVDRVGCGYGRPIKAIRDTITALQGIPLIGGALVVPYDQNETNPNTPLNKARLLRVLLDSIGGVLVYDRPPLDGRSWYAMAETTRLVAAHEELFLNGKRSSLAGLDDDQDAVISDGKTMLVCLINQTDKSVTRKVNLPEFGAGKEFYSGQKVKAGETVTPTLAPGEIAVYVLTP